MTTSKSDRSSQSFSQAASDSFIAPFQVPFLQALGGGAVDLARSQAGQIGSAAGQLGNTLQGFGQDFLGGLGQLSAGIPGLGGISDQLLRMSQGGEAIQGQSTLQALAANGVNLPSGNADLGAPLAGTQMLQQLGQGIGDTLLQPNPGLQGSIGALDAAIQNNLQSTLGTLSGQATLAGATGGSRQALASGLAAQEAQRQFSQGASGLVSQDFAARQALAPAIMQAQIGAASQLQQSDLAQRLGVADLLDRGALASSAQQLAAGQSLQAGGLDQLGQQLGALQAAGNLQLGGAQAQIGASQAGLGNLQGLFNLGLAPFGAAFSPFLAAAQVIGGPAILQRTRSQSSSRGSGSSFAIGLPGGD